MSLPPRPHQTMREGAEFDTIRALMARWGDLAADIGDDAAVLGEPLGAVRVISTDACVENVHFRRPWITPREVGARAAAAAISDLAAMGARPEAILIALMIPDDWRDELADVADGIGDVVRNAGARIIGGNLSRGPVFSITSTVLGSARRAVPRSGAQINDVVLVTGLLGGPGAALEAWNSGGSPAAWARGRFASPVPRWAEGMALADAGATAMIDVSDGVLADAEHLSAASGVRVVVDHLAVPVGPATTVRTALTSGEEYELLATIPRAAYEALSAGWSDRFAVPLTVIGHVTALSSAPDTAQDGGDAPPGFDHFVAGSPTR